jgi:hypothetical protein
MRLGGALTLILIAGALAACGGAGDADRAAAPCDDAAPGPGATFATAGVAFAAPEGEEVQSARDNGGYLPWFAKFGLYVRGSGDVVIRVPSAQRDAVNIVGWGAGGDDPPRTDIRIAGSRCWTGYRGGLIFTGQSCVRLRVEGPGSLRGAARFGLRRACGPETLTRRERFLIARAEVVFATLALEDIDHAACVDAASARRCAANGEKQTAELVDVLRAHPDGIYDLPDEGEVTVTELVAKAADDLREHRPELATTLDAALD